MKRIIFTAISLLWCNAVTVRGDDYHTYTDVFGQRTEARIVKVEAGQVHLEERGGGTLKLPLKSLSDAELETVREWLKTGETESPPSTENGNAIQRNSPSPKSSPTRPPSPEVGRGIEKETQWAPGEKELYDRYKQLEREGNYNEAIIIAKQLVELSERHYGPDHPDTAIAFGNLGGLFTRTAEREEAVPLLERAHKILQAHLGTDHPDTTTNLDNLAGLYKNTGRYEKAEPLYQRVLKARESRLGSDHPKTAVSLNQLGALYLKMGRFEEAESLFLRSLKIRKKVLGPDHSSTAQSLNNLAALYKTLGRYQDSERFATEALVTFETALGPDHLSTAIGTGNLAQLFQLQGRYEEAEPLMKRALRIAESLPNPNPSHTATGINNLALLYGEMGRHDEAESLFLRGLKIWESHLGPDHPSTAFGLNNLGVLYVETNRNEEAEPLFDRALAIREACMGPSHPDTARSLGNLALVHDRMGRNPAAASLWERALEIRESHLDPDHPEIARNLNNLANVYKQLGRHDEAAPLYERALEIHESQLGPSHPSTARSLHNLALLRLDHGDSESALNYARRKNSGEESLLAQMLSFTNEQERLAFQKTQSPMDLVASFGAAPEAARTVLRTKGIVLESLMEDLQVARLGRNHEDLRTLIEEIQKGKNQLKRLLLQGTPRPLKGGDVDVLEEKVRDLEKELARSVAGLGGARASLALETGTVAAALAGDAALVEYFIYRQYEGNDRWITSYGAVVIRKGLDPALVWCGDSREIDNLIGKYRKGVEGRADEETLRESGRALYDLLIGPLLPHADECESLIISPDAQLNFISFATLQDPEGRFLAEKHRISYVAGGRDLLKDSKSVDGDPPLLMGGPQFSAALPGGSTDLAGAPQGSPDDSLVFRDAGADELKTLALVPLPEAGREVIRVAAALNPASGQPRVLTMTKATEESLRNAQSPKLVHLATHGFLLKQIEIGGQEADQSEAPLDVSDHNTRSNAFWKRSGPIVNPMYRSGIALAGAQTTIEKWRNGEVPDPNNDGILMAAEVADLNLRGTELVSLSACSTASGEALSGEGVLGLRRGFVMAGARNLLMTLWPVADKETADFMEDFYTRYAETDNAPKALAEVQRDWLVRLRREKGLVHAVNRAGPFIMSSQGRIE